MTDQPPIRVHESPTPVQIAALLRTTIVALGPLGGFMGHEGWFGEASPLLQYVLPVASAIAFIWGQYATWKHAKQAALMVPYTPDTVATFK